MKKIILIAFITFITQSAFSQDLERCKAIVEITAQAINNQSSDIFEQQLADDFEMAGHKGEIGKLVASQLLEQLNDTVTSFEEIKEEFTDDTLTLTYVFNYTDKGQQQSTFVFNKQNQLLKIELFKLLIKTMSSEGAVITKPKKKIIKIPFFMIGKLIAVHASLDEQNSVFLFDSGASNVILNDAYLIRDNPNDAKLSSTKGVGGSISGLDINKIGKLNFGGLVMENQEVLTLDLSSLEEKEPNIEIHGILGYDLFQDYDLLLDYQKKEIILIDPTAYNAYKTEHFANSKLTTIPVELSQHIPVVQVQIGKQQYAMGIDTGSEANLISDTHFKTLSKQLNKVSVDSLSGADKNIKEVNSGNIKKLRIDGKLFKNQKTVFSDIAHLNEDDDIKIDGIIGYEILSRQKTLISYERKELVFIE